VKHDKRKKICIKKSCVCKKLGVQRLFAVLTEVVELKHHYHSCITKKVKIKYLFLENLFRKFGQKLFHEKLYEENYWKTFKKSL